MSDELRRTSAVTRSGATGVDLASRAQIRTMVLCGRGKPPDAHLRRLIAADAMPDIVSSEDAIGATVVDDRYFATVGGARGWVLRRLPLLAAQATEVLARAREYDAVLSWSDHRAIVVGALMRAWPRRPAHIAILMWPSKPKKALPLRAVLPGIDRLVVRAPLQRRFVEGTLGIPGPRFAGARKAVDTGFWRPMSGAGDLICSVGCEMRDYATLIEALRPLAIPCHIAAGTGILNANLDQGRKASWGRGPLPAGVTVGHMSYRRLRELYARCRFVVVPLLPSDNDSGINAIVEAFAMAKPVICTATPGQTGLLEHGVNCLLVPPQDARALGRAIAELWADPDRCRRLGAAGRALVVERHGLDQWTLGLVRAVQEASAERLARGQFRPIRPVLLDTGS